MDKKLLFSQIDIEELADYISNRVKKELAKAIPTAIQPHGKINERPIDFNEAMRVLGMKERTLRSKVADGVIPHYKSGRKLSFFESELIAYVKAGKVKTDEEIQQDANAYLRKNKIDTIY